MNRYPAYQFSIFRLYLGAYLLFVFMSSFNSSGNIWSTEGIIPNAKMNFTYGVFPSILNYFDTPLQIKIFLVILSILAMLFIAGIQRKIAALLLWYGFTCLLNRNNLIINPSIHYIGWLLLACAIIPVGEPFTLSRKNEQWAMPTLIIGGAWVIFSLGYFLSGIDKLHSASWLDGTAIRKILACPLGYRWITILNEKMPEVLFSIMNWVVIGLELSCLPLAIFASTRKWAWGAATILQAGILVTLNISPIVFGMVAIHIFTFNGNWFRERSMRVLKG